MENIDVGALRISRFGNAAEHCTRPRCLHSSVLWPKNRTFLCANRAGVGGRRRQTKRRCVPWPRTSAPTDGGSTRSWTWTTETRVGAYQGATRGWLRGPIGREAERCDGEREQRTKKGAAERARLERPEDEVRKVGGSSPGRIASEETRTPSQQGQVRHAKAKKEALARGCSINTVREVRRTLPWRDRRTSALACSLDRRRTY